ncbi:hypothetical protein [Phreatobacter sp.]|uniref:hypothetical protein n=1 Tax=Phreatobacter sp. TaxID=1966341 RepID=UPI003F70F61F
MFRLIKACFWLGLVVYFLPETAPAPRAEAPSAAGPIAALTAPSGLAGAVTERTLAFCRDNPAACAEGIRLVGQAMQGDAASQGDTSASQAGAAVTDAAEGPARDTLTPADLAVPFGGVTAPAGSAPRRAPLPPRRPV